MGLRDIYSIEITAKWRFDIKKRRIYKIPVSFRDCVRFVFEATRFEMRFSVDNQKLLACRFVVMNLSNLFIYIN